MPRFLCGLVSLLVTLVVLSYIPLVDSASTTLTVTVTGGVTSICNDGIDNDADGLTDYPADSGCSGATDEDEYNAPPPVSGGSGGGGGGGGGGAPIPSQNASVVLTGRAYPGSTISVLKDSVLIARTPIGETAAFSVLLANVTPGSYVFTVYAEDPQGIQSSPISIPVTVAANVTTTVSGIFIAPTLDVDKTQVKRGNPIRFFGRAAPESAVVITVNSSHETSIETKADEDGIYNYSFLTFPLEIGSHSARSIAAILGEVSRASKTIGFTVGTKDVLKALPNKAACPRADLNGDCRVNLIDFSIAAFWYKKSSPPALYDLNADRVVNLVDLSIMASQWTG